MGDAVRDQPSGSLCPGSGASSGAGGGQRRAHRRREFQRAHALAGYFDDIHFAFRRYDPLLAYGQSKTANIVFAVEATARWKEDGITTNALTPGAIATNLQRYVGGKPLTPLHRQKTPQQGVATSVLLATSPLLEGIGGRYFVNCNEAEIVSKFPTDMSGTGVAPFALDPDNARRLWEVSLQMLDCA